jgi:tetratricopeptide (TPR) repeat protein
LYAYDRYELAERELRGCLVETPEDYWAHAMLANVLSQLYRFEEATAEAELAISVAPGEAYAHYVMAHILYKRKRFDAATTAIDETIRLNPNAATYRWLSASIHSSANRTEQALAEVEIGLRIDPNNVALLNLHASYLLRLGRRAEALASLDSSLRENPENASTHEVKGWTLVAAERPVTAIDHFRESLRLDPDSRSARQGLIRSVRLQRLGDGWMDILLMWADRTGSHVESLLLAGLLILCFFAESVAAIAPPLGGGLVVVTGLYVILVAMTWLAEPLFHFSLRFYPLAKYVVRPEDLPAARCVSACLMLGIPLAISGAIAQLAWLAIGGVVLAALSIPLAAMFRCVPGKARKSMAGITFALAVPGFVAAGVSVSDESAGGRLVLFFLLGVLASMPIANSVIALSRKGPL